MGAYLLFSLCWIAGCTALAIGGLITGKTMTPLNGTRPFIVSRDGEPRRYWFGIISSVVFAGIGVWFLAVGLTHR